jgi:hypothetical protein
LDEEITMAIDGTWGFVYCGVNGLGIGVFMVADGKLDGTDSMIRYTGTVTEDAMGKITADIVFDVMPGVTMVQGTSPQDIPYRREIHHTFPPNFGDGVPQVVPSPPGTVTLMIKRLPNDWAPAVIQGFTLTVNPPTPSPSTVS